MFGPRIKLDKSLYRRAAETAEQQGYASVDEFVAHLVERAVTAGDAPDTDAEVEKQLRGLGYIE